MNTESTSNNSEPVPPSVVGTSNFPPARSRKCRPHDKIARLPKSLRDQVNLMLDDGVPYNSIIANLQQSTDPPLPYPISEMNISRWKDHGYQLHLAQQERLAYVRQNREAALELVANDDTTTLPEAALQIIACQYYDILTDFSPGSFKKKLAEDPLKYIRFLNIFARLTREIVNLKKHRELCTKTAAADLKHLDPDRDLIQKERELILAGLERALGLKPAIDPIGPDLNEYIANSLAAKNSASASQPLDPNCQVTPEAGYSLGDTLNSHPSTSN